MVNLWKYDFFLNVVLKARALGLLNITESGTLHASYLQGAVFTPENPKCILQTATVSVAELNWNCVSSWIMILKKKTTKEKLSRNMRKRSLSGMECDQARWGKALGFCNTDQSLISYFLWKTSLLTTYLLPLQFCHSSYKALIEEGHSVTASLVLTKLSLLHRESTYNTLTLRHTNAV